MGAAGAGHGRIIFRHMIPNCLALYIVMVTVFLGIAIVAEATLSFLGVGVPPDVASWGGMLRGAAQTYVRLAPWLGVFPGLAIGIVVFAWNLLGDALRDFWTPGLVLQRRVVLQGNSWADFEAGNERVRVSHDERSVAEEEDLSVFSHNASL